MEKNIAMSAALNALKNFRTAFAALESVSQDPTVADILKNVPCSPFKTDICEHLATEADCWAMFAESDINCKMATDDLYSRLHEYPMTAGEMEFVINSMMDRLREEYAIELG